MELQYIMHVAVVCVYDSDIQVTIFDNLYGSQEWHNKIQNMYDIVVWHT